MCVLTKENVGALPLVAEQDIPCYKVLRHKGHNGFGCLSRRRFSSVVRQFEWRLHKTYKEEEFPDILPYGVTSNGFYAWGENEETYAFNKLEEYSPDIYTVVKCVIPKGTRYYMSDPDRREHSDYPVHPITYCAEQMKAVAYYRNGKWVS